ncbi:hypothetical protein Btru_063033 [Bulinus truncatus]|nr:hypothetical protein Btru_063033 [Bulinus truncatus]
MTHEEFLGLAASVPACECSDTVTTEQTTSSSTRTTPNVTYVTHAQDTTEMSSEMTTRTSTTINGQTSTACITAGAATGSTASFRDTDLFRVDRHNTSLHKRTLISVPDHRISSRVMGGSGIIIVTLIFTLISSTDLIYIRKLCAKRKGDSETADPNDFCSKTLQGGALAEILNDGEMSAVIGLLLNRTTDAWIGASDTVTEGVFLWSTSGLKLPHNSTWWIVGQPSPNNNEDCVAVAMSQRLTHYDCGRRNAFLCQHESKQQLTVMDPCYPLNDASYFNGKCMKTINTSLPWEAARSWCESLQPRGRLLEIFTEEDRVESGLYGAQYEKLWTGGHDPLCNKTFVWSRSPAVVIDNNTWFKGEPNDAGPGEDCTILEHSGLMNDVQCGYVTYSICQYLNGTNIDSGTTVQNISADGRRFQIIQKMQNFTQAQMFCESQNGTLAELLTSSVMSVIASNLIVDIPYYIGATDSEIEGRFVWSKNRSTVRLNWWSYLEPTAAGQPECCVEIVTTTAKLNDNHCNNTNNFICQIDRTNPCDSIFPGSIYISGQCFKYYNSQVTWQEANLFCLLNNLHLAEPDTYETQSKLVYYIRHELSAWLGGSDVKVNRAFRWTHSTLGVSSQFLQLSDTTGHDAYILWYNTPDNVSWVDRPGEEKHGFLCQKAAVASNPQRHVAVLPKLSNSGSMRSYVQVTTSYSRYVMYVTFREVYDVGIENVTPVPLVPPTGITFTLSGRLVLPATGKS